MDAENKQLQERIKDAEVNNKELRIQIARLNDEIQKIYKHTVSLNYDPKRKMHVILPINF